MHHFLVGIDLGTRNKVCEKISSTGENTRSILNPPSKIEQMQMNGGRLQDSQLASIMNSVQTRKD